MARPYQFSDPDKITSPLDRRPPVTIQPADAPAAFRQNMNRNKTKKWVDAKSYAYDGDDWGDYDEDDEYGTAEAAGQSSALPKLQRPRSFERGDESRTFSATTPITAPSASQAPIEPVKPAPQELRIVSEPSVAATKASEASIVLPEHRRDFSPSAMPPPLSAKTVTDSTSSGVVSPTQRPPSSIGAYDPRETSTAVPFVRPADIYKRIEEARSKESLAKASNDKLREASTLVTKPSLANIPEVKSEHNSPVERHGQTSTEKYRIPSMAAGSEFGDALWSPASVKSTGAGSLHIATPTGAVVTHDTTSPTEDAPSRAPSKGFKSMVNRAFEPSELLGGVSKQDSVRSYRTDASSHGTADISPILASVRESGHDRANLPELSINPGHSAAPADEPVPNLPKDDPSTGNVDVATTEPGPADATLLARPKIPGQFDSYAFATDEESASLKQLPGAIFALQSPKDESHPTIDTAKASAATVDEVPDLSPSVSTKPIAGRISPSQMTELSAAGVAMGAALEQVFKPNPPESADTEARPTSQPSAPPTPPAKDLSRASIDDELAPPVPLKTSKASEAEPVEKAVLQSTALAPTIATAQTVTLTSPKIAEVEANEASRQTEPAQRTYTSMLDIGEPTREVSVPSQPPVLPLVLDTSAAPRLIRQFSWETDTPAASDAPVASPHSPEVGVESTLRAATQEQSLPEPNRLSAVDATLSSTIIQDPVSPLDPNFNRDDSPVHEHSPSEQPRPVERTERLPSFREIMAIKSNTERTLVFDTTRKEWLAMNSGLDQWLAATLDKHPEHGSLRSQTAMPFDGSAVHGNTGSRRGHLRLASMGTISKVFSTTGGAAEHASPDREKRASGGGAGKAVGDTLKGLGDRSKGLIGKIKASRRKDDDGH